MKISILQKKIYYFISLLLIFVPVIMIIINLFVEAEGNMNLKWGLFFVYAIINLIFVIKDKWILQLEIISFTLITFLYIPFSWIFIGGKDSYTFLYIILVLIGVIFSTPNPIKSVFVGILLLESLTLLFIELHYPEWIHSVDPRGFVIEGFFQVPLIFFSILYMTNQVYQLYQTEKEKAQLQNIELKEMNEHLLALSQTDFLSQIANRGHIQNMLEEYIQKTLKNNTDLFIILFDIDNFKFINEKYGYRKGDKIIHEISTSVELLLEKPNIIGRYGGNEFLVLLPNSNFDKTIKVMQKIKKSISTIKINKAASLSFSAGLLRVDPSKHSTAEEVLHNADQLLFEAKSAGKNTYISQL